MDVGILLGAVCLIEYRKYRWDNKLRLPQTKMRKTPQYIAKAIQCWAIVRQKTTEETQIHFWAIAVDEVIEIYFSWIGSFLLYDL